MVKNGRGKCVTIRTGKQGGGGVQIRKYELTYYLNDPFQILSKTAPKEHTTNVLTFKSTHTYILLHDL